MANGQDLGNVNNFEGMEVHYAPLGTSPEKDLETPLTAAWTGLGVVTTDSGSQELSIDSSEFEVRGKAGTMVATRSTKLGNRMIRVALAQEGSDIDAFISPLSTTVAGTGVGVTETTLRDGGLDRTYAVCLTRYSGSTLHERIFVTKSQPVPAGLPNLFGDEPGATEVDITVYREADGAWGLRVSNNPAYTPTS